MNNWKGGEEGLQPKDLEEVKFCAYQIQEINEAGRVDSLVPSNYDMLVLEPTRTDWSSVDRLFDTVEMVTRLKNSTTNDGAHSNLIIAYIDIGEA